MIRYRTAVRSTFAGLLMGAALSGAATAAIVPGDASLNKPLIDTQAGLGWFGFATQAQGEQAGYRLGTSLEVETLLVDAGYARFDFNNQFSYSKSGPITARIPGIDAYQFTSARLSSSEHADVYLGWALNGGQYQLIGVSDSNTIDVSCNGPVASCARNVGSVGTFNKPGTMADAQAALGAYIGTSANPPNFMMVRAVPEPASALMWILGLGAVGVAVRRQVTA